MDEIRRRRQIRHRQEQRRRAAIRRRNALLCAAVASAVIGAVIGSGAGRGPGAAVKEQKTPKLARGGVGPPTAGGKLVQCKGPVPILMYHVIDNAPPGAQLPELYVGPTTFDQQMKALDMKTPDGAYPKFTVMGKVFDPEKADAYVAGFAIKRT